MFIASKEAAFHGDLFRSSQHGITLQVQSVEHVLQMASILRQAQISPVLDFCYHLGTGSKRNPADFTSIGSL